MLRFTRLRPVQSALRKRAFRQMSTPAAPAAAPPPPAKPQPLGAHMVKFLSMATAPLHSFPCIRSIHMKANELVIETTPARLPQVVYLMKQHSLFQFKNFIDIGCTDYPDQLLRFHVNYFFMSLQFNSRITITTSTSEAMPIPSITPYYAGANWAEREVWDLYGVFFMDHMDLRRILTDYGFQGHPLRKDFPMSGFVEVFYNDVTKSLLYEPVEMAQTFRKFSFNTHPQTNAPARLT